jgi:thiosulfate/3-mercaptopyruvate sulfurtransferase
LEAWERVLISQPSFFETVHGRYGCITCHGGTAGTGGKEEAHEGMVREPASAEACGDCHPDEVAADAGSLHSTLAGYTTALSARSAPDKMAQLDIMMANHCDQCHTSCGQCHVSRPTNLDGGLVDGHLFKGTPAMNLTCTGCHGSRIEDEYKGKNEGVSADVHWIKGGMSCFACHSADEMHGALDGAEHRYDGAPQPACQDAGCHPDVGDDDVQQHTESHFEAMSCQVCHSTTYKNCYSCHVAQQDGVPYYQIEPSVMDFKIGRNPLQSEERPWKYVPLRHVPIDPESFHYYGENLLPNFDALPTWKYATPHNIQRITPQNETCQSCHGNAEFFLTADDVLSEELEANEEVIVEDVPFEIPIP